MSVDRRAGFGRVWGVPIALALGTFASLVGALLVEGAGDWLATFLLAACLAYAVAKGWRSSA